MKQKINNSVTSQRWVIMLPAWVALWIAYRALDFGARLFKPHVVVDFLRDR